METDAAEARRRHRLAAEAAASADTHREARDAAVRRLRASDPARWTHRALARAVGCSEELIAAILRAGGIRGRGVSGGAGR